MREAIGGALLIKIVMVFIAIYVCFLGIAINYSITFRVKNQIINLIEEYEGYELAQDSIRNYIASVGYYMKSNSGFDFDRLCPDGTYLDGYCISEKRLNNANVDGKYYRVTAYVQFDFPILGNIFTFPVSGETKLIYKR